MVRQQTHLPLHLQSELEEVLRDYPRLFDGSLGRYPHREIHLELIDGAQPVHLRPYSVPKAHEHLFKTKLQCLCDLGVLERCGSSEWAAPSFIVPKEEQPSKMALGFLGTEQMYPTQDLPSSTHSRCLTTPQTIPLLYKTRHLHAVLHRCLG